MEFQKKWISNGVSNDFSFFGRNIFLTFFVKVLWRNIRRVFLTHKINETWFLCLFYPKFRNSIFPSRFHMLERSCSNCRKNYTFRFAGSNKLSQNPAALLKKKAHLSKHVVESSQASDNHRFANR